MNFKINQHINKEICYLDKNRLSAKYEYIVSRDIQHLIDYKNLTYISSIINNFITIIHGKKSKLLFIPWLLLSFLRIYVYK